jgi:uncharacterized protein
MRRGIVAFAAGVLFAAGLGLSGMTQPDKVLAFLDFAGAWDPALAFVMAGAVGTYMAGFFLLRRRRAPVLAPSWQLPAPARLRAATVAGATLFGIGWGLVGFCPGPAVVGIATLAPKALVFFGAMTAGLGVFHAYRRWNVRRGLPETPVGCGDVTGHLPALPGRRSAV